MKTAGLGALMALLVTIPVFFASRKYRPATIAVGKSLRYMDDNRRYDIDDLLS